MKNQENLVERRERARVEVMVQLEDITYRTLRKYGVHVIRDSHNRFSCWTKVPREVPRS